MLTKSLIVTLSTCAGTLHGAVGQLAEVPGEVSPVLQTRSSRRRCDDGPPLTEEPELIVADAAAWREWLATHHAESGGVWLVVAKGGATTPTRLTYDDALDEALAHGWIDAQALRRDDASFRLRFTPRRRRSPWSKRNTVYALLYRIEDAQSPETRARRIKRFAAMLAAGETVFARRTILTV
jgi:uncharacterized protein YdeI (YjbR/CyaY-like superfamily)